ncbi:unnamed protein product, partial [Mesorhabditis spiculigera]
MSSGSSQPCGSYSVRLLFDRMFPTSRLPKALISAILDQLAIQEMVVLQRVTRQFRAAVNARCLMPRRVQTIAVQGGARRVDEEDGGNEVVVIYIPKRPT